MGPTGVTNKEKSILISVANELTYPEFHLETENKVDSHTCMQQYKSNYVLNGYLQYSRSYIIL